MKQRLFASIFTLLVLSGCSAMKPRDFAGQGPALDIFRYFRGETRAWGLFEDRFGMVRRQFRVDVTGTVDGDLLTLDERFVYNDGETDRRIWRIRDKTNGEFEGEAADVVGKATGTAAGNALNWTYEMNLKVGGGTWRVTFDDWMFLQEDGVLINRARVKKWGVEIGQVTLFFKKP